MKLSKRILSCLLSLTIAASALGAQAYADYGSTGENAANEECNYNEVIENRNEAAYYDISAAINYAKIYHTKATNDTGLYYGNGGGDCAYFVSRCLSNGGINVNYTTVSQFLKNIPSGFIRQTLYSSKNGIPTGGQNAGKVSTGDVLVYSCACGYPHVSLVGDCSGSYVKVYSHTPAMGPDCKLDDANKLDDAKYYVCKNGHGINNGNGGAEVLHYTGSTTPRPDDFIIENGILTKYNGVDSAVKVPYGVTEIGQDAFKDNTTITSVLLPDTLKIIGCGAFYECSGLRSINIPSGVKIINASAFYKCGSLSEISLPDTVEAIGVDAFRDCISLTDIHIPTGMSLIDITVFAGCSGLKSISITGNIKSLGNWAFQSCSSITEVNISEGTTSIGAGTFYDCSSLKTAYIPHSINTIAQWAFGGCPKLSDIYYNGTQSEWNSITWIDERSYPADCTIHYTTNDTGLCKISAIADQTYTGAEIIPDFNITYGSDTLIKGTDYTVSYSNNINAGTATVTITGMGNYTGTNTATFEIVPKSNADCTVSSIAEQTYTGSALTPPVTVKDGTKTLTKGTDYTVSYSNNINAGTATVTITGKGNYTGTKTATFTIKAAVPVVTATPGDAQVILKWNAVPDADKYAAYIVNADGTLKALATKLTGTTYTAAKLTNGTTYKFLVRAYVDNSWSKYTDKDIVAATPISTRPEIIEATAGDSEVALTWTTVDGAEKYAVYCVDAAGSTKCLSSRLTTASYTAKKLTNGKAYKFYVRAYVNGTWSKFTAANMVQRTPVCLRPSVKAEAGDAQVTLTWSAINGAEKYAAYRVGSDGTLKALSTRLETTEYTAKKLTNGTKYKFLVRAYVNGKWTPYDSTNMVTCTPVSSKPVVKATAGNGQVTLNWGKVTGASKYAVYVVNSDNTLKCLTSKLTANTYTVKNLVNGKTYKYVVRAYVNGAWSKYTTADYVSATPKA